MSIEIYNKVFGLTAEQKILRNKQLEAIGIQPQTDPAIKLENIKFKTRDLEGDKVSIQNLMTGQVKILNEEEHKDEIAFFKNRVKEQTLKKPATKATEESPPAKEPKDKKWAWRFS